MALYGVSDHVIRFAAFLTAALVLPASASDLAVTNDTLLASSHTDTLPPRIRITAPTAEDRFATSLPTISIAGEASDNVQVQAILWANRQGDRGLASGTLSWQQNDIALVPGMNVLVVTAVDLAGNRRSDELIVDYTPNTGQSGQLNDTGLTWGGDFSFGNNNTCSGTLINQQDCSHGRDVTHADHSDGYAGFSFIKLDHLGAPLPANAESWHCVRDAVTGLVWEVKTRDGGLHDAQNAYRWGGTGAMPDAGGTYYSDWNALVDASNSESLCGLTNWRVPFVDELTGIVSYNQANPPIDADYFPNTIAGNYWSASAYASNIGAAWVVDFYNGIFDAVGRIYPQRLRLVSGPDRFTAEPPSCNSPLPAATPDSQLADQGNGTILDLRTGLQWKQCSEGQNSTSTCNGQAASYTWEDALNVAEQVNTSGGFAGFTDWRIPNVKEFLSIVETACANPAINSRRFPNTPASRYWTSSAYANHSGYTWYMQFSSGNVHDFYRVNMRHVRLVRDAAD